MTNRRDFLKGALAGSASIGLGAVTPAMARGPAPETEGPAVPERPRGFAEKTTIFCQLCDPGLLAAIGNLAQRLGCDVWLGEPFSPDLIAIPFFVAIVDRHTMGPEHWGEYMRYRWESGDDTPVILVDGLGTDQGWPMDKHMAIWDLGEMVDVGWVLGRIRETHSQAMAP